MDFSEALKLVKQGERISRANWNGKGQFVEMQTPDENSKMGLPYLYITTVDGKRVPWLASQTDLLAEDWAVLAAAEAEGIVGAQLSQPEAAEAKIDHPAWQRVARTRSSGDRVYLLDDQKKTRQWVYDPNVLESLGFSMADVGDIEDNDLLKYNMGPAILKPVSNEATQA